METIAVGLEEFGQTLNKLRKAAGLSQQELANLLFIDVQLLSKWERAYHHRGRHWKPDRQSVIRLVEIFVDQLNPQNAQLWALQASYELSALELQKIFPTYLAQTPRQFPPLPDFYVSRQQIELAILSALQHERSQTLVLLGPGGIGKTTLAACAAKSLAGHFPDGVIWVENRSDDDGEMAVRQAQDWIARSFWVVLNEHTLEERARELRTLLHNKRCLLILDDLWATHALRHLRLQTETSRLLVTTRDAKVAAILEARLIRVPRLTDEESLALLAARKGDNPATDKADELVARLGGLPLALSLSRAQLQVGLKISDLLAHFRQEQADLSILDMDDPQTQTESLTFCFDLSYHHLGAIEQQRFAQSGCFAGAFEQTAIAAVWAVGANEAHHSLQRLLRFALLEWDGSVYRLHPLLRDYAQWQLAAQPEMERATRRRHAAWHILHALYHPQVLDDVTELAPDLDQTWTDVVAGVKWAAAHEPRLATWAALLAHTERVALLEEVGPDLITVVTTYLSQSAPGAEQAILYELLGDLYLLKKNFEEGLTYFDQAASLWETAEDWLAASRARLRVAGAHLLCQEPAPAAEAARWAQSLLAEGMPIASDDVETARWLFYWFDMIYNALVRWEQLSEEDVASLARLARRTNDPLLEARGLHIYRLWCTAEGVSRPAYVRQQGRELAVQACKLWRACGRMDRADDEISWSGFLLDRRYSQRVAARFARRLSRTTPVVSQDQIQLVKSEGIRWWLGVTEADRVSWLSQMLPRYLGASNCPAPTLSPDSQNWRWVDDILNVGMLGDAGRRLALGSGPLPGHILNGPEWRVLSGQKAVPLVGRTLIQLVEHYLDELKGELSSSVGV